MISDYLRHRGVPGALGRLSSLGITTSVLTAIICFAGCRANEVDHEDSWYVWALGEIRAELLNNAGKVADGPGMVLPDGVSSTSILERRTQDGAIALRVQPAFAEGKPAAYVTTDVWLNLPKTWLQPAYIQIEDWGADPTPVPDAPVLIDVESESIFYSPFWNIEYAVVGPGADPSAYDSTRALLDTRPAIPLHRGGPRDCPISPLDFLPTPVGTNLVDPTWGIALPEIPERTARFNGETMRLLDFGPGSFDADGEGLVEALPFFLFARRTADGTLLVDDSAHRVAGVGPLGSNRPAVVVPSATTGTIQPRLGMFWQLVVALLPPGAEVFQLSNHPGADDLATAAGLDVRAYEGRVAFDNRCLDDGSFPTGCTWLDSQARIEGALGQAGIIGTEITVNSPFLLFDRTPVSR